MTNHQKLRALRSYFAQKVGLRMSNEWLQNNLNHYVFTEAGIFHIDELPEQVTEENEIKDTEPEPYFTKPVNFEIDTEPEPENIPFSDPPEPIDDPDFEPSDIDYPDYVENIWQPDLSLCHRLRNLLTKETIWMT